MDVEMLLDTNKGINLCPDQEAPETQDAPSRVQAAGDRGTWAQPCLKLRLPGHEPRSGADGPRYWRTGWKCLSH